MNKSQSARAARVRRAPWWVIVNEDVMCDDYPPSPKYPNEEEKAAADDKTAED
jgi:hypothetical protein